MILTTHIADPDEKHLMERKGGKGESELLQVTDEFELKEWIAAGKVGRPPQTDTITRNAITLKQG
jgi:hypothetical protein